MQAQTRQFERMDRHVLRSYVRIGEGVSRYRVESSLQEALRMAELPGEREGRLYFFRRVRLAALPGRADRRAWMERAQAALGSLAAEAVHGRDARAASSNAVYFDNQEQSLETLLRDAILARGSDWIAAAALGVAPAAGCAAVVLAVVERLHGTIPAAAAAQIVLSAAGGSQEGMDGVVRLLEAIPDATARAWVRAIEARENAAGEFAPVELRPRNRAMLAAAARHFGWKEPCTLWLASLAVRCAAPAAFSSGSGMRRTRTTLRVMEEQATGRRPAKTAVIAERRPLALVFEEDTREVTKRDDQAATSTMEETASPTAATPELPRVEAAALRAEAIEQALPAEVAPLTEILGEPTDAAGLYFLLHVLRRLEIKAALEACPALGDAGLAAHVLREIAVMVGVAAGDPILLGLGPVDAAFKIPDDALAAMPRAAWPSNLRPTEARGCTANAILRAWMLGVRRWCLREGQLPVREIVARSGRVWMTRTDLDVTLPLKGADLRIRRLGLDIDPGWVPWLGEFGRVVRFHYRSGDLRAGLDAASDKEAT